MRWVVIGYSWCPFFDKAKQRLLEEVQNVSAISIECEHADGELIQKVCQEKIGNRLVEGSSGKTSPQIICLNNKNAVCVPGYDKLSIIPDLRAFERNHLATWHKNYATWQTFVKKTKE